MVDHGSSFQFRFTKAVNVRRKNGDAPNAAVYAKWVRPSSGRRGKTVRTALLRSHNPEWLENVNLALVGLHAGDVPADTRVTFYIIDMPNPRLLPFSYTKIAKSKDYALHELVDLRNSADPAEEGFSLPLEYLTGPAPRTDEPAPRLVMSLRDFLTQAQVAKNVSTIKVEWASKNERDLKLEIESLRRELLALSADLPTASTTKTVSNFALGSLNYVVNVATIPRLHTGDTGRASVLLLQSQISSLRLIREHGPHGDSELVNQLYELICARIISSHRKLLALCESNGGFKGLKDREAERKLARLVTNIHPDTCWFENFQPTEKVLLDEQGSKSGAVKPLDRADRRASLIASNPNLVCKLGLTPGAAIVDSRTMDPQFLISQMPSPPHLRNSSTTTQLVSSWVFSDPSEVSQRLLWLHGEPGCGKTRFGASITEALSSLGVISAYHSFDSSAPSPSALSPKTLTLTIPSPISPTETGDSRLLGGIMSESLNDAVASLAFQLAAYNPTTSLPDLLADSLDKDVGTPLSARPFPDIFSHLIVKPLSAVHKATLTQSTNTVGNGKAPAESITYDPSAAREAGNSKFELLQLSQPTVLILDAPERLPASLFTALLSTLLSSLPALPPTTRILVLSRSSALTQEDRDRLNAPESLAIAYEFSVGGGGDNESGSNTADPASPVFSPVRMSFSFAAGSSTTGGSSSSRRNSASPSRCSGEVGVSGLNGLYISSNGSNLGHGAGAHSRHSSIRWSSPPSRKGSGGSGSVTAAHGVGGGGGGGGAMQSTKRGSFTLNA